MKSNVTLHPAIALQRVNGLESCAAFPQNSDSLPTARKLLFGGGAQ